MVLGNINRLVAGSIRLLARQNLAGIKGLIGRRWAMHANGAGELEAAFYHERWGKKQGF
jgi:hypothetical protein